MKRQEVLQAIQNKQISPLYIVEETDDYLITQFLTALQTAIVEEDDAFEQLRFDLNDQSLQEVIDEATSFSFFANKKLLLVAHPTFLWADEKGLDDTLSKAWLSYLDQQQPDTVVVLLNGDHKRDRRRKIVKETEKHSVVLEEETLNSYQLMQFIQSLAEASHKKITNEAVQQLITMTNGHLGRIHTEWEKIELYMGDNDTVTESVVQNLVAPTLEHHLFEISDNVLHRRSEEALALYHDLLLQGEDTIKMNFLLMMQFRLYLQVAILHEQRYTLKEMAKLLNVHPYRVELAMKQSRGQSMARLAEVYNHLVDAEYAMKTSALPQEMIFELLLTQL